MGSVKQSSIKKNERIKELFFDGDINKPEYNKRKSEEEEKIAKLQEQMAKLLKSSEILSEESKESRETNWKEYFRNGFLTPLHIF